MCSNSSEQSFSSALVWPYLLGLVLLVSAYTAQVTHLRLLNTRPRFVSLRSPLLRHHVETSRLNVIELRPQRHSVRARSNLPTR